MKLKDTSSNLSLGAVLVATAAAVRLLPHPWNFVPTTALAIFSGAEFSSLAAGTLVMFLSLFVSDLFLGFHETMPVVYGSLFVILLAGRFLRERKGLAPLCGVTCASSVFFFLTTNFGVFILQDLYPKSLGGLLACYTAALPFFQNSLLGDLFYVSLLFGAFELLRAREESPRAVSVA